jgi:release factor glutamine methyltransferase
MDVTNDSLQNQKNAIAEMKERGSPVINTLGGNEITALPNVYAGWLDSELMCEVLDIPKDSRVLDLCTGTGVIAIKAAQLGAKNVIAVDLNPEAVKSAILNKNKLGLQQVDVREGSLFEPIKNESFDVIIINPPYINHEASDKTEICFWDAGNTVTKQFFEEYQSHLNPGGTVYLGWGDFADMGLLDELAKRHSVRLDLIGSKATPSGQETFLAYKLIND